MTRMHGVYIHTEKLLHFSRCCFCVEFLGLITGGGGLMEETLFLNVWACLLAVCCSCYTTFCATSFSERTIVLLRRCYVVVMLLRIHGFYLLLVAAATFPERWCELASCFGVAEPSPRGTPCEEDLHTCRRAFVQGGADCSHFEDVFVVSPTGPGLAWTSFGNCTGAAEQAERAAASWHRLVSVIALVCAAILLTIECALVALCSNALAEQQAAPMRGSRRVAPAHAEPWDGPITTSPGSATEARSSSSSLSSSSSRPLAWASARPLDERTRQPSIAAAIIDAAARRQRLQEAQQQHHHQRLQHGQQQGHHTHRGHPPALLLRAVPEACVVSLSSASPPAAASSSSPSSEDDCSAAASMVMATDEGASSSSSSSSSVTPFSVAPVEASAVEMATTPRATTPRATAAEVVTAVAAGVYVHELPRGYYRALNLPVTPPWTAARAAAEEAAEAVFVERLMARRMQRRSVTSMTELERERGTVVVAAAAAATSSHSPPTTSAVGAATGIDHGSSNSAPQPARPSSSSLLRTRLEERRASRRPGNDFFL